MERKIAQSVVQDWSSLRENDNGIFKVLENFEKGLKSEDHETRMRFLTKVGAKLSGDGYFMSRFLNSNLLGRVVIIALADISSYASEVGVSVSAARQECDVASDLLARNCKHSVQFLHAIGETFLVDVVDRLCLRPTDSMYLIVESFLEHPRWNQVLRQDQKVLQHLVSPRVAKFRLLSKVPEEAIKAGAVEGCLAQIRTLKEGRDTEGALNCLHIMTFFPEGRKAALVHEGVHLIAQLLKEFRPTSECVPPAIGTFVNLLEDPTHQGKEDALKLQAGQKLWELLEVDSEDLGNLDKCTLDRLLFSLQAISVYCSHPIGQKEFTETNYVEKVRCLASEKSNRILSRTAKNTLEVIERKV